MLNPTVKATQYLFEAFYAIDKRCTSNTIEIFLIIASNEGITQTELTERLNGRPQQTVSSTVKILENQYKRKSIDYGLVESLRKPDDLREWEIYLTPKGKKIFNKFIQIGGDEDANKT